MSAPTTSSAIPGLVTADALAASTPAAPPPQVALLSEEERDAAVVKKSDEIIKTRAPTRRSGSAPPEESGSARAARQLVMNDPLVVVGSEAEGVVEPAGQQQQQANSAGPAAASTTTAQRRRSTRTTAKEQQRKDAGDSGANDDEEEPALLPPTTTLLFTTSLPPTMTLFEAPPLPITLQTLIEVPDFRILGEGELPMGRLRIQPNSGQQTDFSDEYYLRRHAQGEALERKGRKQERDRLVTERNRIKHQVEQLRLEVASASFYANPSPVKPPPPSFIGNNNNAGSSASTSTSSTSAAGGRHSTPVVSERMRESERNKRRQLQEAEDILRRYDELLQPREPYVPFSANAANGNASNAPRTWLTGGKGIPPPPDGVSPSEFLNAPRGTAIASAKQAQLEQHQQQQSGRGSAMVAQRRLAQVDSGNVPSPAGSPGSASGGRVTRLRSSSPAVHASPVSYRPITPAPVPALAPLAPAASTSGSPNHNTATSPQRFVPILPRPSTSGSFMPAERRQATTVTAAGPSSLTLKIRQAAPASDDHAGMSSAYQPTASTSNAYTSDGALASRRRTRALQPIDIRLSREDNYSSQYGGNHNLKRSASDAAQLNTGEWQQIGTGRIRPLKKRKKRRKKGGESSEEDDGAREAEMEMEASKEFIEDLPDETSYISNLKSSYASVFQHNSPLGTPDDPDDADNETPRTAASTISRRTSITATEKPRRPVGRPRKEPKILQQALPTPVTAVPKYVEAKSTVDDTTDYSDGGILSLPPAPPLLPSIHIDRASSASLSNDEPVRRAPRQSSTRASTPSGAGATFKQRGRPPRQLFHRPDKPVEALLERSRYLVPDGRKGSPLPGRQAITSSGLARAASPRLSTIEKAALTFESEGDLSSLPSDTDDAGEASEFQDSESRFRSERALWRLEAADAVAPSFLGAKGAAHGATSLATSVLPEGDDPSASNQLANMLDPMHVTAPKRRGRPPKSASITPEPGNIPSQVTVGGLKTRKRPQLDDYPVNDLNEVSEAEMSTLRESYQHVAARKKEMMGSKFSEMPIGDWQVFTPESDIRHT